MPDNRIRKNERCVIGLPACDYVFSSTRSCFIAYGFSTSSLEKEILTSILIDRGIEPIEAGERIDPGKFAFCTKICSKIIVAQFCIVLLNLDSSDGHSIPNANVNMEYGLILGHNKHVIPFQRHDQTLPFNVSGLDTIKYTDRNFKSLAVKAIDQAVKETSQSQPTTSFDQVVSIFLLIKNATLVNLQNDISERIIYQLGAAFSFNLLVKFDGLGYIFLGNFGALQTNVVIWRLSKLLELLAARLDAVPIRISLGLANEQANQVLNAFIQRLQIWLIVASDKEEGEVRSWLNQRTLSFPIELFTTSKITELVSELPQ